MNALPGDAAPGQGVRKAGWQRRTLPPGRPSSTIRAAGLNFRVRDGIGCVPCAVATNQMTMGREGKCLERAGSEEEDVLVKPLGPLVRLSYTCYHASTCRLSTCSSRTALRGPRRVLGVLILGGASHLDAFSGYPFPTSLPGDAPGGTAGTRVVSPLRSSRTRSSSPQYSNAHDGYRPNCLTTF